MGEIKSINYTNKDFSQIKESLKTLIKSYYPDKYNDFNDSSVEMMYIDTLAYIGNILSFYQDKTLNESILTFATNPINILNIAQSNYGYKPILASSAIVDVDIYQLLPAVQETPGGEYIPNYKYALKMSDVQVKAESNNTIFNINDVVDFSESGSIQNTIDIYETDNSGLPTYFLAKKTYKAYSGETKEYSYTVSELIKYLNITVPDDNIIKILDITDSDGNIWYEVNNLANDLVETKIPTSTYQEFSGLQHNTPFILEYSKVSKRFITKINSNGNIIIQFGAGISDYSDELIIPNQNTLYYDYFNEPVDPKNFVTTRTYGEVPQPGVTLTIRYLKSNGVVSNVKSNDINKISNYNLINDIRTFSESEVNLFNFITTTLACNNELPAVGAKDIETYEQIKINAPAYFSSQDRCVTIPDYNIRVLTMNPIYGSVAKSFTTNSNLVNNEFNNQSLDIYCLGYDYAKHLIKLNEAVKYNIKNYLSNYKMANDVIYIKDAYIINIIVEFDIICYDTVQNKNEVILNCVKQLKDYFNIDNWQIGQPIILNEIKQMLDKVSGVRTVENVIVKNIFDNSNETYSDIYYDIEAATKNGVIYTAVDLSIFEVKYPDVNIYGRAK